jgi:hypothetical protein
MMHVSIFSPVYISFVFFSQRTPAMLTISVDRIGTYTKDIVSKFPKETTL